MKFQLLSDIHLEYYKKLPDIGKILTPSAPNLILAGNICYIKNRNFTPFFEQISQLYQQIFYILGEHEYFMDIERGMYSLKEMEITARDKLNHLDNVHIIQDSFIKFDNIVIIGSTLWSYISKKDMIGDICYLTDTNFIKFKNRLWVAPRITNKIHLKYKKNIDDLLSAFEGYKKLVVTHFLPSFKCIPQKLKYDSLNKSYYSNCDDIVKKADVWCAGHSFKHMTQNIDETPVYVNPVGYLWQNSNYKKDFVFYI